MKLSIILYGEVALEFGLDRTAEGQWELRGVFPKFLGRPCDPHLTLFAQPREGLYTPHFTATRRGGGSFRRTLARISVRAVEDFNAKAERAAIHHCATALEPVDLALIEAEGWTVHWLDSRVVRRALRIGLRKGLKILVDDDTLATLALHLLRHAAPPSHVRNAPASAKLVCLHLDSEDVPVRLLLRVDASVRLPKAGGSFVELVPGWYWQPIAKPEALDSVTPMAKLERAAKRIEELLTRFPKRAPGSDGSAHDALPPFVSLVAGVFASDVLQMALDAAVKLAEEGQVGIQVRRSGRHG